VASIRPGPTDQPRPELPPGQCCTRRLDSDRSPAVPGHRWGPHPRRPTQVEPCSASSWATP